MKDTTTIYVRFRKDLDDVLTQTAEEKGVPKATYVRELFEGFLSSPSRKLSSLSSSFFAKQGRALGRSLGKPMRITMEKKQETLFSLLSSSSKLSPAQFRTAVIVTMLERNGSL